MRPSFALSLNKANNRSVILICIFLLSIFHVSFMLYLVYDFVINRNKSKHITVAGSGYVIRGVQGTDDWINSAVTNCCGVEEWRHVELERCSWSR